MRLRAERRDGNGFEIDVENAAFTRLFLGVGIRPHRRLRFHAQGMDARAPTIAPERLTQRYRDVFELREAYVEIGDPTTDRFTFLTGRQLLSYGRERVVGRANWSNSRRAFDAVRLRYHSDPVDFDVFSGSVVQDLPDTPDRSDYGNGLHGVYSTWKSWLPDGQLELYLLYRTRRRISDELGRTGDGDLWAPGLRLSGSIGDKLDYETELTIERGELGRATVRAYAFSAEAGYRFAATRAQPRAYILFDFATGDKDPTDGVAGTFDQLFPSNHRHRGLADVIGYRNVRRLGGGVNLSPAPRLGLKFEAVHNALANRNDAYYTFSGQPRVAAIPGGAQATDIGIEYDLSASYKLDRFTTLTAGVGRLVQGGFLRMHSEIGSSTFSYAAVEFKP